MSKRQNTRVQTTVIRFVNRNALPVHVADVVLLVDGEPVMTELLIARHYLPAGS